MYLGGDFWKINDGMMLRIGLGLHGTNLEEFGASPPPWGNFWRQSKTETVGDFRAAGL